jgi:hypothetical protein
LTTPTLRRKSWPLMSASASLGHRRYMKDKHGLKNLELHRRLAARHGSSQVAVTDLETVARKVFQNFRRFDLLAMALTPPRLDN